MSTTTPTRTATTIPDPPSRDCVDLTFAEAAGFLRIRRRGIDALLRSDETFPKPVLITPGAPRIRRSELEAWAEARPTGWSTRGGLRNLQGKEATR